MSLLPTFFNDIQQNIDKFGYVGHDDIISAPLTPKDNYHAPIPVHDESDWYQNFMFVGEDRLQRYTDFVGMDAHPLMSSALDIYAEESSQKDAWGNVLQIHTDDQVIKEELEHLLFKRLNINHNLFRIVRETCKYGDKYQYLVLEKNRKGVLFLKDMPVQSVWRLEWQGKLLAFVQQTPAGITPPLDPFSVVHWRIALNQERYKPYGTSIFDPCRRHYRQLVLMEDAMVVYRITRAPERRVFFVNCGRLPTPKAEEYMKKITGRFRKRSIVNPVNGEIDWRSNPLAPDEDFYIPIRDGNDGTRIEQLAGAQNLGEVDDVVWFKDQILAYLKIPRVYLQDTDGGSSERRENLCLDGDTKIALLDGTSPTIKELSEKDEDFWVYSINEHNKVVPGLASGVKLTRSNTEVVEVELDNGEKVISTPDHPFMKRDGTYCKAEDLKSGESLMPLYRKISGVDDDSCLKGYEKVYNPKSGKWPFTHRMVEESLHNQIPKDCVVHHCNFNKRDNSPNNLKVMNTQDHAKYHIELASKNITPEVIAKRNKSIKNEFIAVRV